MFGIYAAVLNVLSGGNWVISPLRVRLVAALVFFMGRHEDAGAGAAPGGRSNRGSSGSARAPVRAAVRRYAFTIVGIAIGVAGLVALGAMAERIVRFIEGGDRFVLGQISVAGRGMGMGAGFTGGGMLPARTLQRIARGRGRERRAGRR